MAQAVLGSSSIAPATSKFFCEKLAPRAASFTGLRLSVAPAGRHRHRERIEHEVRPLGVAAPGPFARQRRIGQRLQLEAA